MAMGLLSSFASFLRRSRLPPLQFCAEMPPMMMLPSTNEMQKLKVVFAVMSAAAPPPWTLSLSTSITPLSLARSVAEMLSVDAYGPLNKLSTLFIDGVGRRIVGLVSAALAEDVSNATSSQVGHMYSSHPSRQTAHAGLAQARLGLVKLIGTDGCFGAVESPRCTGDVVFESAGSFSDSGNDGSSLFLGAVRLSMSPSCTA